MSSKNTQYRLQLSYWIYRWLKLILWMLCGLLMYAISRVLMYGYHRSYFNDLSVGELLRIFAGGLRFDWVVVSISNLLLFLMLIIPVNFIRYTGLLKKILILNFFIFHIIMLFNLIDIPYFSYIHKRSTADLFFQLGGQTDVLKQLPQYFIDYWWLLVVYLLMVYGSYRFYRKNFFTMISRDLEMIRDKKSIVLFVLNLLCLSAFSVVSIRGGLQRIPLDIVDAAFYASPEHTALVINSPFSIIKSFEQSHLEELHFFDDTENRESLKLIKHYPFDKMIRKNIVVIVLESFSKEYTSLGSQSFTPFLDSLMKVSMVFENGWSNGTKSIEGIPAVVSSMPSWMDNPFINSLYSNNSTHSFPLLLKKENYYSAFFHGGINGTMNFDAYARQAGFDAYFGKNEYNNDADFDGYWGIWDEPFLQFAAKKLSEFRQPFFATIFTLSSHHPFKVPAAYRDILPKGNLPVQQCIAYTDWALKKFFNVIQKMSWYKNTIFVLTADHTGISEHPYYSGIAGRYQIPVVIFNPSDTSRVIHKNIIQQIDILPTTLYLLHYPYRFFSFGNNYFDTTVAHSAVFYENGHYYLADDSLLYTFKNFNLYSSFRYKNGVMKEVQADEKTRLEKEYQIKRIIQAYNNTLIKNNIK